MKHTYEIKVRFGDTDAAGIMFYPNFYRRMDEASHELFETAGYSVSKLQRVDNIIIPILEAYCQFKMPLFFEDQVSINSEVVEVRGKTFRIKHQFLKYGNVAAEGYELRAWTSMETGKPKAVPVPYNVQERLLKK